MTSASVTASVALQRGRRLETTERGLLEEAVEEGAELASTGPSSGDDGEEPMRPLEKRAAILTLQRGRRLETTERRSNTPSTALVIRMLQRGRRLETTESAEPRGQQRVRHDEASTGPSSGDDGERGSTAALSTASRAPCFNGAVVWRRRRGVGSGHLPVVAGTGFNGAVVWRRRRGRAGRGRRSRADRLALTGPSSGDDGESMSAV